MWDYLVRWRRVKVVLWICHCNALDRKYQDSVRYCADHSLLLLVFWLLALVGGLMAWVRSFSFSREAAGDVGKFQGKSFIVIMTL